MKSRLWLLLGVVACKEPASHQPSAAPKTSAPAVASASVSAKPPERPPLKDAICRALRVEGEAKVGDAPLGSGAALDGSAWVTLGPGASLTLKHSSSGRELAVSGPALFRACRRGREQLLLTRGIVRVGSGLGSRPGAEVLIATPIAMARYAEADFTLKLDDKKLAIEVRAGQLELDPAEDKPPKGMHSPLRAKDKLNVPLGRPDPVALMERCKAAAEAAVESARKVGDRSAAEPLGQRAQAHVRARRAARAACTIAVAATGLAADPSVSAGLWADASRWEGLWEAVPRLPNVQPTEK
jgi:hypothetical protein